MSAREDDIGPLNNDITMIVQKISLGNKLNAIDKKTIKSLLSLDITSDNSSSVFNQIFKILKAVHDSEETNKDLYSGILENILEFLKKESTIANLSKNKELATKIQTQLKAVSGMIPSVKNLISELQTKLSGSISSLPVTPKLQDAASTVATATADIARQFAHDAVSNPKETLTPALKAMRQNGTNALREARDYAVSQEPASQAITRALKQINNFKDLKAICEQVISSGSIKGSVQLKEDNQQLQVLSKNSNQIATIEMGKRTQEGLPIQCTFVSDTLRSIVPASSEKLDAPLKPEIESVVKILKETGEQPFELNHGSLSEVLEICRTCAKLEARVHVNTEDPTIKAAVTELGKKMGVSFLPELSASRHRM